MLGFQLWSDRVMSIEFLNLKFTYQGLSYVQLWKQMGSGPRMPGI